MPSNITSHHAHLCCLTKPRLPSRPHQRIQSPCCVLRCCKKPRSSTDISKHQVRAVTVKQQYTCLRRYHLSTTMEAKRSSLLPPDYVVPLMDRLLPSPVKPSAAGNHPLSLPSNSCPLQSNQALPVIVLCHFRHCLGNNVTSHTRNWQPQRGNAITQIHMRPKQIHVCDQNINTWQHMLS